MAEDTQGTDTPTTAPINVPDKPALEGLEDALTRAWSREAIQAHAAANGWEARVEQLVQLFSRVSAGRPIRRESTGRSA